MNDNFQYNIHESFMARAIELSKQGIGYVSPNPLVGCVLVKEGEIIGEGFHEKYGDPHAEIMAYKNSIKNPEDSTMYVTLEPCHMCAKAIIDARIDEVIFAAPEPKTGSIISIDNIYERIKFNHKTSYKYGLLQNESSNLLKKFFKTKR